MTIMQMIWSRQIERQGMKKREAHTHSPWLWSNQTQRNQLSPNNTLESREVEKIYHEIMMQKACLISYHSEMT